MAGRPSWCWCRRMYAPSTSPLQSRGLPSQRGHKAVAQPDAILARAVRRVAGFDLAHDHPRLVVSNGPNEDIPERVEGLYCGGPDKTAAAGDRLEVDAKG